jgi:hypothetical protein
MRLITSVYSYNQHTDMVPARCAGCRKRVLQQSIVSYLVSLSLTLNRCSVVYLTFKLPLRHFTAQALAIVRYCSLLVPFPSLT